MDAGRGIASVAPLVVAAAIWPVTFAVFQALPVWLPPVFAYLGGFVFYWVTLLAAVVVFLGAKGWREVLFVPRFRSRTDGVLAGLCLAFVVPPIFVAFLPSAGSLTTWGWAILLSTSLLNGLLEESFWRGVFAHRFAGRPWLGFVLPTLCFTLWHISPAAAPGMVFQGGMLTLLGGALAFGLLAGTVAYRQRSIVIPVISHVLLNVAACSKLLVDNWPKDG